MGLKINKKDQAQIVEQIQRKLSKRKSSEHRKNAELRWATVDKLIAMDSDVYTDKKDAWRSTLAIGDLAEASEVITKECVRLIHPESRRSFSAHVDVNKELGEDGRAKGDPEKQKAINETLESLMEQQHKDIGLVERTKLSIKEALHHGSFVAIVDVEKSQFYSGDQVKEIQLPVWRPMSMWKCYPDDSEAVIGTSLFYNGSMIIEEKKEIDALDTQKWINKTEILRENDKKLDMITYYGTISIKRGKGKKYFHNMKVIVANGRLAYFLPSEFSHSPVIYAGYERDDIRNPYYTSPIMKVAPNAKAANRSLNLYIDSTELHTLPTIVYDSLDPAFIKAGGVTVAPGQQIPSQGAAAFKEIKVGDPMIALRGFQVQVDKIEKATGVDATRAGIAGSTDMTAFEVNKKDQKGEIRTIDFVRVMEKQGIRPFLYMQHALNKKHLDHYSFYNTYSGSNDFEILSAADLKENALDVRFDISGSRDVLGEEQRRNGMISASKDAASDPAFRQLLKPREVLLQIYQDSGVLMPERFLKTEEDITQEQEGALQEQLQEMQEQIDSAYLTDEKHQADIAKKELEIRGVKSENSSLEEQIQNERKGFIAQRKVDELEYEKQLMILTEKIHGLKTTDKG